MPGFDMSDYITVPERVDAFKGQFPEGSLQSEIVELTPERVTVKAYAYRTADDERPGIGHSSLNIPGSTPYTKGSEIENCETSAWGRAIAALGFEVKRGIASSEEVRNKQSERGERAESASRGRAQPATTPAPAQRTPEEAALLDELAAVPGMTTARASLLADAVGVPKGQRANADQLRAMLARTTIELPSSEAADAGADGARASAPADTPPGVPTDAATAPAPATPLAVEPESAPTDEEILAVTGGEMVTPKARAAEEAIADAEAKSKKVKAAV